MAKQTIHCGSIAHGSNIFIMNVKRVSLNRSTWRLVFKNNFFDFGCLCPKMYKFAGVCLSLIKTTSFESSSLVSMSFSISSMQPNSLILFQLQTGQSSFTQVRTNDKYFSEQPKSNTSNSKILENWDQPWISLQLSADIVSRLYNETQAISRILKVVFHSVGTPPNLIWCKICLYNAVRLFNELQMGVKERKQLYYEWKTLYMLESPAKNHTKM